MEVDSCSLPIAYSSFHEEKPPLLRTLLPVCDSYQTGTFIPTSLINFQKPSERDYHSYATVKEMKTPKVES